MPDPDARDEVSLPYTKAEIFFLVTGALIFSMLLATVAWLVMNDALIGTPE